MKTTSQRLSDLLSQKATWRVNRISEFGKFESDELESAKRIAGLLPLTVPLNISSDISLTRAGESRFNIFERLFHLRNEARFLRFGFLSLLIRRLRHGIPLHLVIASIVIYFIFAVLSFSIRNEKYSSGVTLVDCPRGYAIRIPPEEENAGRLLPCENFDQYYQSLEGGEGTKAQEFLFR